ncbi:murein biosynthesis integral membrane protein MurJ [Microbacterium sp. W1N]|uniref:murein biosynthesis integral membrane protein MurJ n=1 Tax=Microbacterium festucae TaxID=2977531 RepID=UPI0021C04778|nr:murein biosynthesis integral membrane protein MurJ [Microbacterium festucae]MCT9819478.1 murein biosynthesis integral membrane protein MurJ [Microbacterium festucae]
MASLGRASAVVAAGTLASRATGLIRNIVLAAALGTVMSQAADAFGIANQLPNTIFALISSGLLAGVIVPQIVRAVREHDDHGSAFVSKLLTLGIVALTVVTAVAMVAAPVLVQLYGRNLPPEGFALALALAYWCLPQLFFYGLYALMGEILNARKVFGPYAWSPIINNIVSIIGFGAFVWLFGLHRDATGWTPEMVGVLGGTATLGIVLQTVVLFFFWRRASLSVRADFHWRGIGLRQIGRLAGWTFLMVLVGQLAALYQVSTVSAASGAAASVFTMQSAWTVFILPYSVIVMSIGTPYYTRIAEHATVGDTDAVKRDLDAQTRIISLLIVGALVAIVAAIIPISRVFTDTSQDAVAFAFVLAGYLVALVPLSLQFGMQRTFYAFHDTRTPFFFTVVQAVIVIATTFVAVQLLEAEVLPLAFLACAIALGQSVANFAQLGVAATALRRKIGPLGLGGALRALAVFLGVGVVAGAVGWGVFLLLGGVDGWAASEKFTGILAAGIIGIVTLAVYGAALLVLRVPELQVAMRAVRRFLPGK